MEEIIKDLEQQIQGCIRDEEDLNDRSWGHEQGVLITANQAKQIVEALKVLYTPHIELECNRCCTVYKATPSSLGICCTTPVEHRTSGICGGQLMMKPNQ